MERKILFSPRYLSSLCYSKIQRARVNGVTPLRVLINEPRAPSSPYSFSPLDSTPSIFNHKEVSALLPPRLSRLLLWPVIATYVYTRSSIFLHIPFHTCGSPVLARENLLPHKYIFQSLSNCTSNLNVRNETNFIVKNLISIDLLNTFFFK